MKNARHMGKQIEWWIREVRPYFSRNNWLTYHRLKEQVTLHGGQNGKRLVLFNFHDIAIDNVGGRYLYHLVQDFVSLGYTPCYKCNYRFIANMQSKGFKKHLLDFEHIIYQEETALAPYGEVEVLLSDHPPSLSASHSPRKVLVDYSLRRAQEGEVALRFGPSPVLLRDGLFTEQGGGTQTRRNRIFFAGRTRAEEYGRDLLLKHYGMLNRLEMIELTREFAGGPGRVVAEAQLPEQEWQATHDLLIIPNDVCRVPREEWMPLLQQSAFFLACPGSEMPLCHNVIEALAAGAIPIIEYADYISPGLTNGVNCLTFSGERELRAVLHKALDMPAGDIATLRENVQAFYSDHYQAGKLAMELLHAGDTCLVMNDYRLRRERSALP